MREVVCYPETINTTLLWRTLFNTWIVQTWVPESGRHGSTSHGPLPQRSLLRCNWQEWASLAEAGDYLLSHDMDSEENPRQQVAGTCFSDCFLRLAWPSFSQNLHLCKRVLYRNNSHKIELIWIPKMSAIESHTRLFFSEFHSGQDKAHYLTLKFPDGLTFLTPRPRSTKQESDKNLSVQKTRLTYLSL